MKVYHYTNIQGWDSIKTGKDYNSDPGLLPIRRIGKYGEAHENSAIFCLTDPLPEEWTHNTEFKNIWNQLKKDIGKLLLEVEVDENDKSIYVIDRAHIEGVLYTDKKISLKNISILIESLVTKNIGEKKLH